MIDFVQDNTYFKVGISLANRQNNSNIFDDRLTFEFAV